MSAAPLLELPAELWDRILFWMSLRPSAVANFARASRGCHLLAFGPVGDRDEYNLLQHGALLGPQITDRYVADEYVYFKYISAGYLGEAERDLDQVLLTFLRMADRGRAAACLETAMAGLPDEEGVCEFDGDTLFALIQDADLTPRTKKLLRQVGEEFGPSDFREGGESLIHAFGAVSGIWYGDGPPRHVMSFVAALAAVGGQRRLLYRLLESVDARFAAILSRSAIPNAVKHDQFEFFDLCMDYYTAVESTPDNTYFLFLIVHRELKKVVIGNRYSYHLRIFQELEGGGLPVPKLRGQMCKGIRDMILENEYPEALVEMCARSEGLARLVGASLQFSAETCARESLLVIDTMFDSGYDIACNFGLLVRAFDAASRYNQTPLLAKLIFQTEHYRKAEEESDPPPPTVRLRAKGICYASWYATRVLIVHCKDRDWAALRRSVEDFAEEADEGRLARCYRQLSHATCYAWEVVGHDQGAEAVREIAAAFTPWLFGGVGF